MKSLRHRVINVTFIAWSILALLIGILKFLFGTSNSASELSLLSDIRAHLSMLMVWLALFGLWFMTKPQIGGTVSKRDNVDSDIIRSTE